MLTSRLTESVRVATLLVRYGSTLARSPTSTRRLFKGLRSHVLFQGPPLLPNLPEASLHDLFPGIDREPVSFCHRYEGKALPYADAYALAAITAYVKPRSIFEIGTWKGGSALIMARQAPGARIFTLDLDGHPNSDAFADESTTHVGELFRGTPFESQITQLGGDSLAFDYAPYVGSMDLVFVDGDHSHAGARADTRAALTLLSDHGIVVWDDCMLWYPGVIRALNELGVTDPIWRILGTRLAVRVRRQPNIPGG